MTTEAPQVAADPAPAPKRPRRWRPWAALGAVVVVVAGAAITWTAIGVHYAHAAQLQCACALAWDPPDAARATTTSAVGNDQITVPARHDAWQSFDVQFYNPASVTQTILGPADGIGPTAWAPRLTVSRDLDVPARAGTSSALPVAIAPHEFATLRYSVRDTQCMGKGQTEFWTGVDVRVRVGAYTRTETIDLGGSGMAIVGTGTACR